MVEKLSAFEYLINWSFKYNVYIKRFVFTQLSHNILYGALEVTILSFIWNNPPTIILYHNPVRKYPSTSKQMTYKHMQVKFFPLS